jgi:hypothetical protein
MTTPLPPPLPSPVPSPVPPPVPPPVPGPVPGPVSPLCNADELVRQLLATFTALLRPTTSLPATQPEGSGVPFEFEALFERRPGVPSNDLTQYLDSGRAARMSYVLRDVQTGQVTPADTISGASPTGSGLSLASRLLFKLCPRLTRMGGPDRARSLSLEWTINLTDLPGCGSVTASIPGLPLVQRALPLPALVIAFDGRNYEGSELRVFLAPGNPILSDSYVDRSSNDDRPRTLLVNALSGAADALTVLSLYFGRSPDGVALSRQLHRLRAVIGRLNSTPQSNVVIDGRGQVGDLGTTNPGWYDRISSLVMVSVPGPTLQLFEKKDWGLPRLQVRVPAEALMASYWTIHESLLQPGFGPSSSLALDADQLPEPGPEPPYPFNSFGNMAKSSRWTQL